MKHIPWVVTVIVIGAVVYYLYKKGKISAPAPSAVPA